LKCKQLRVDEKLRKIATEKLDEKILTLTSRDIVAAEAHYHNSCYREYTRERPARVQKSEDTDSGLEKKARKKLIDYIRTELFSSPSVVSLVSLQEKLANCIKNDGAKDSQMSDSMKKNLKFHLQQEFRESLRFLNVQNRVYVVPDTLSFDTLVTQYVTLKNVYENKNDADDHIVVTAARSLRCTIKSIDTCTQMWPPHPDQADIEIPGPLKNFLEVLFGRSDSVLTWSMSQDIIQGVLPRKIVVKKHVLLPTVVKTLTGNVELITFLNRLGHGCNYSKLLEIDTGLCMENLEAHLFQKCFGLI
jgi:hypothetical protein